MTIFLDYFDNRYREAIMNKPPSEDGPVITISRQTGCDARQVAENVVDNLNTVSGTAKWKWIDKDIIYKIAECNFQHSAIPVNGKTITFFNLRIYFKIKFRFTV